MTDQTQIIQALQRKISQLEQRDDSIASSSNAVVRELEKEIFELKQKNSQTELDLQNLRMEVSRLRNP